MTKIIGLTGGIGSGKTTIAKLFEAEGIPVYIADLEAKKIMQLPQTIQLIKQAFGNNIIHNDVIDTKVLSAIVFNDAQKLNMLNGIVHPLVKKHFEHWVISKSDYPFVIKESAILFESGSNKYCDQVIVVVALEETRIKRVMARDNCTREQVLERIKNQWSEQKRIDNSDFVIQNENIEEAKKQFKIILKKMKNQY
jgi:dephospho-CoA kinase